MKILSRLKIKAETIQELDKRMGIDKFLHQADAIESQSDFLTYNQIKRICKPLAQKLLKEADKLKADNQELLANYLIKKVEEFRKKNFL